MTMDIDPLLIVNALIFLGALVAFEGIREIVAGATPGERAISRRMRLMNKGASSEDILKRLRRPTDKESAWGLPFLKAISKKLKQSGSTMKAAHFFLLQLLALGGIVLFLSQVTSLLYAAVTGLLVSILLPLLLLDHLAKKRETEFIAQLPEALDQMSRGLRVGHPLNTTIAHVANTMPDPIGTEFGLIADQVSYGDDLVDAVAEMADRVDIEDAHYFAVALGIQHGTGGNLARVLSTLGKVIRDRDTMRRRIRAISSEGRMSMIVLSLLNPIIFVVMQIVNPSFFGSVMDDPLFMPAMAIVATLTVINYLSLRRQVNFRI